MMISLANPIHMLHLLLVLKAKKLKLFSTIVEIQFGNGLFTYLGTKFYLGIYPGYLYGPFDKWSDTDPSFIFDFLIHDQFNQQIQVDVYDKDADWDDHLGGFSVDITDVINNSPNKSMMQWFKLDDGAKGEVRLQLCFLELSQNKVHHG